jgi:hypothetical protein
MDVKTVQTPPTGDELDLMDFIWVRIPYYGIVAGYEFQNRESPQNWATTGCQMARWTYFSLKLAWLATTGTSIPTSS